MTREAIVNAASKMESVRDLLLVLNKVKMDELGENGHPFTMPQLNYFINPKRSGSHYKTFFIPKKSGGEREISAPTKLLKSFQTYVGRILQAFYDAPDCVTGFVPERSIVDNAKRHIGSRYVFNTDLKDFFPSIPQARVWGALRTQPFCFPEKVASAIAGLCCKEEILIEEDREGKQHFKAIYILPQGSPCSPVLTNIVCHNLDWKLSGLARRFHLRYSRYADDITFSSDYYLFDEDGEFMKEFRRIVSGQNFCINEKKTRIQKRGERQEVTGLVVSDCVNVPREYIRDIDNLLYIWEKYGADAAYAKFLSRYQPKQNLHHSQPDMHTVILGKLMYLRMVKGDESPVWRKLQKRFNRLVGKKESFGDMGMEFSHVYLIEAFEKIVGISVDFTSEYGASASIDLNGVKYPVMLSRYARTRLGNILAEDDDEALQKFKERFCIGFCHDVRCGNPRDYLMVFRKPSKKSIKKAVEKDNADAIQPDGLSTDRALDELVASGFNLTTLDKWDKTKNN